MKIINVSLVLLVVAISTALGLLVVAKTGDSWGAIGLLGVFEKMLFVIVIFNIMTLAIQAHKLSALKSEDVKNRELKKILFINSICLVISSLPMLFALMR